MTIDTFLAQATAQTFPSDPLALPEGAVCARSGEPITEGYLIADVVAKTTPVIQDVFRVRSPYLSVNAGRMFASGRLGPFGHFIAVMDEDGSFNTYRPMISRESSLKHGFVNRAIALGYDILDDKGRAVDKKIRVVLELITSQPYGVQALSAGIKECDQRLGELRLGPIRRLDRPCWTDFLAHLEIGATCVTILADDTKKRLWPDARISRIGPSWEPYLQTTNICRNLRIDYERFLDALSLTEEVYGMGFSKNAIMESLLDPSSRKAIQLVGWDIVTQLDRALAAWRSTDELLLAAYISQKE